MTKILIIGGPGSGKTTLGRSLAAMIDTELYVLDVIGYENGAGPERPIEAREADIQRIVAQDAWIAEGSFIGWTEPLAAASDVIVWLDVSWRVARWRIISRHAKASFRGKNQHPGLHKLWKFLQSSRQFYIPRSQAEGLAQLEQWLSAYGEKVLRRQSNQDVASFMHSMQRESE